MARDESRKESGAPGMEQPRGQDRDSLFLLALMRVADQPETQRIKVRNLSPSGMMAESPLRIVCGERVLVELRNIGWISGTVAWVSGNRFGVVFDAQIDCKLVRVTSSGPLPEIYVPRPLIGASAAAHAGEPGMLRRI